MPASTSSNAEVAMADLAFPVIGNVDAAPNKDRARVGDLLIRQGE